MRSTSERLAWGALAAFVAAIIFLHIAFARQWIQSEYRIEYSNPKERFEIQATISVSITVAVELLAFGGALFIARFGPATSPFRSAGVWGCLAAGMAGAAGALVSQFAPVLGNMLERYIGGPFSTARLLLLPGHVLLFAFLGLLIGGLAGALRAIR